MIPNCDYVPVPLSIRKGDGRYAYVNRAWCEMFSIEAVDALDHTDMDLALDPLALLPDNDPATHELTFRDVYVTTRHKGRLMLELIETRLPGDGSILCVHQDVTGIGWRLEDMTRTLEETERRSRQRLQNLVQLSRALCDPLEAMTKHCSQLQKTVLTAEQAEWVDLIKTNTTLLHKQIERAVDLTASELGEPLLEERPLRLDKIIRTIVGQYQRTGSRLILQPRIDPSLQTPLMGDETKLRQIVLNMLDSAVDLAGTGLVNFSASADHNGALAGVTLELVRSSFDPADETRRATPCDGCDFSRLRGSLTFQIIRGLTGLVGGRFELELRPHGTSVMRVHLRMHSAGS